MSDQTDDLPSRIARLREAMNWTQGQLADELGVEGHRAVSRWERGENRPSRRHLAKIEALEARIRLSFPDQNQFRVSITITGPAGDWVNDVLKAADGVILR